MSHATSLLARRARLIGLVAVVGAALASCSGDGTESGDQQAPAKLTAALRAHQEGRLDTALGLYQEVIALEPDNKFAWYNLGLIHQTRGENAEAEDGYRQAIKIDPRFVGALFNLAVLRTEMGDGAEAIELYRQIVEIQPGYAPAHLNLGFALIDAGSRREGKAELQIAVGIDPSLAERIPDQLMVGVTPSPAAATPATTTSPSTT